MAVDVGTIVDGPTVLIERMKELGNRERKAKGKSAGDFVFVIDRWIFFDDKKASHRIHQCPLLEIHISLSDDDDDFIIHNVPVENSVGYNIGMGLNPGRIVENGLTCAVLRKVCFGDRSSEDVLSEIVELGEAGQGTSAMGNVCLSQLTGGGCKDHGDRLGHN